MESIIKDMRVVDSRDLLQWIADNSDRTFTEVEAAVPDWYYEGDFKLNVDSEWLGEVFDPVRKYMKENNIKTLMAIYDS